MNSLTCEHRFGLGVGTVAQSRSPPRRSVPRGSELCDVAAVIGGQQCPAHIDNPACATAATQPSNRRSAGVAVAIVLCSERLNEFCRNGARPNRHRQNSTGLDCDCAVGDVEICLTTPLVLMSIHQLDERTQHDVIDGSEQDEQVERQRPVPDVEQSSR